jgi:hypothetical protein
MPLNEAEARRLSNDELQPKLGQNQKIRVPLNWVLPVLKINGHLLRVANIPNEQPLAGVLPEGGAVPEQTQIPVNIEFPLGLMSTEVTVNDKTQLTLSNVNDQAAVQLDPPAHDRLWYRANQLVITGNPANAGEFLGWRDPAYTTPRQTVDASGGFTLQMLDQVQGLIRTNSGFGNFMYMPRKVYNLIRRLCYAAGFLPQHEAYPVPDGAGGFQLQSIMHWNGWPMFFCDDAVFPDIVVPPNSFSEIYCGFAGPDGVAFISPQSIGERLVLYETVLTAGTGQKTHRLWLPIATARFAEDAIARISNIPVR